MPLASVDLRLEFSAPVETDGAIMALCTPRIVSVGTNLGFKAEDKRVISKATTTDKKVVSIWDILIWKLTIPLNKGVI